MTFASNSTYSSAPNPIDVGQANKVVPPDLPNGFKPEAPVCPEHVNYCLNRLEPVIQRITASTTWNKPAGAKIVEIVLIGGGAGGLGGASSLGGAGGQGGEIVEAMFDASDLPSSLSVVIGAGGTGTASNSNTAFCQGVKSTVTAGSDLLMVAWGGFDDTVPAGLPDPVLSGAYGGNGGASGAGSPGVHSRKGPGGAAGAANAVGVLGKGYGAGGGGGRQSGGTNSGGGGGGGGYGTASLATSGSTNTGGNGAPGICIITTWREIS